jgi:hypothetical protein
MMQSRRGRVRGVLFTILLVGAVVPAAAEGWEIVPTIGYRTGGELTEISTGRTPDFKPSPTFGLTANREIRPGGFIGGLWSRQPSEIEGYDTDFSIDYLHFQGIYEPKPEAKSGGYVVASAGVTFLSSSGSSTEAFLSLSAGGGGRFALSRTLSLKVEGRAWASLVSGGTTVLCDGGCIFAISGAGLFQFELSTGLAIAF